MIITVPIVSFLAKFSTFYFIEYFDYRSIILTNIKIAIAKLPSKEALPPFFLGKNLVL